MMRRRTRLRAMTELLRFGKPVHLVGDPPQPGEPARDFTVHRFTPETGIVPFTLADLPPKPRLLSAVPSLDTPVCSAETKTLNHRIRDFGDAVAAYTISLDLPFAQARWCGAEGVTVMETLSDWKTRSFGTSWGVLVEETQLLARAVFVLDAAGTVVYTQVVPEITHEPEYEPVLAALEQAAR
jgi:thioredoxin-dependent peroxiredoxin